LFIGGENEQPVDRVDVAEVRVRLHEDHSIANGLQRLQTKASQGSGINVERCSHAEQKPINQSIKIYIAPLQDTYSDPVRDALWEWKPVQHIPKHDNRPHGGISD